MKKLKIVKILVVIFIILVIATLITLAIMLNKEITQLNDDKKFNQNTQLNENTQATENNEGTQTSENEETLFQGYYKQAEEKLKQMTLEEKISQMFMARCPSSGAVEQISAYQPGGYILFGRDFEGKTKQQVINMIQSYQTASKIPMIIGVDEEGGLVCRVSSNKNLAESKFKSPQQLYKEGGLEKIRTDAIEKSQLLLSLGINMNLAPVSDVSTDSSDFIYSRSFGKGAEETSEYVKTVVNAMKSQNIAGTLKHFPGYGNNKDSHTAVTVDNRSLETFEKSDFLPFKAGIEAGVQSILVSHNKVNSIDADYPASLSSKMHEILRKELKFEGLIMTDDLAMDAAAQFASKEKLAVIAVQAGNDIILTSDYETQRNAVINAVKNNEISEERINESAKRILAYKYYMKLM